jgi:hypothetical protein
MFMRSLRSSIMALACICTVGLLPAQDLINGLGGAAGFGEGQLPRGDDNSNIQVDITSVFPGGLNYFGTVYTRIWVNTNGVVTFDAANPTFTPSNITAGSIRIIAPFYADVDTRGGVGTATPGGTSTGSNLVYYDLDPAAGVFTVTWDDVGYYNSHIDLLNAFQLRLKRRAGGGFTIEFRYEAINWTTGDASGGTGGLGGTVATAGWSGGNGTDFFALPQSSDQAAMLALETTYTDSNRVIFTVNADGTIGTNRAPVATPQIKNVRAGTPRDFRLSGYDPDGDDITFLRENPLNPANLIAFPTPPATFATTGGGTILLIDNTTQPPLLRYTPPATAVPFTDTFRFGCRDPFNRDSVHETYTFNVSANVAPVATSETVTVYANETTPILLTGTDANEDPLTFVITAGPTTGTATGVAPSLQYTPPAGFLGQATVTFTANDGLLTSIGTMLIDVVERPLIIITSPNGGERFTSGGPATITWTRQGNLANISFHYSVNYGASWDVLVENVPNTGSADVVLPAVNSEVCLVSAVDIRGNPIDSSDAPFAIGSPDEESSGSCGSGSGIILIGLPFALLGLRLRRRNLHAA